MQLSDDILPFLDALGRLPRHLISDGYDQGLDMLLDRARTKGLLTVLHEYPTGYDCGTWIIPEKWTLRSARLLDLEGRVLLDAADNGLVCMSYSQPFSGVVSREELLGHLHIHENLPDAVPFMFSYYRRNWGLCCSRTFRDALADAAYRVEIDAVFSPGRMRVAEIVVPGKWAESFVLAAHMCHPHQLNDGPLGAALCLDVLESLAAAGTGHTIRLLVGPETVGTAAWLSRNRECVAGLRGGLFCEMLTVDLPFVLNASFWGDSLLDALFAEIVRAEAPDNRVERFNYGNDERQFNGPGVDVPMAALHRSHMSRFQEGRYDAYPEYHSDRDDMRLVSPDKLARAAALIRDLVAAFDRYLAVPRAAFRGEPFLSRYDLHDTSLDSFSAFMDVVNTTGRGLTVFEIGRRLGLAPEAVRTALDALAAKGLMEFAPCPRTAARGEELR